MFGRPFHYDSPIIEFAAVSGAFQPVAIHFQLRSLVRTSHQKGCIFFFTKAIDANGIF